MKKRIAIWLPGGIGTGNFSQGYPMLPKLVERLCDEFEIVAYSHTTPNIGYHHDASYLLKYPPRNTESGKIRWLYLLYFFLRDQWQKKFDLTFAFWGYPTGFFVVLIKKILRIPCVINVLGGDSASIPSIDYGIFHKRFPRLISTWAYRNCSLLLAISEFQKVNLIRFGIERDIQVIPWGADDSMYRFSEKSIGEVLRVIHVGHLNPVKDQVILLKAFARIIRQRPAHLKILGVDTMDGAMQRLCVELGIEKQVEFVSMVPYYQMPQYYQEADIMLHTSLSEGQCMALTEAAATGVLMAGTKVGLLYDLGDDYAVTVDIGDYETLAKNVLDVLDSPTKRHEKIERSRLWSEAHNFNWTVGELSKLLKTL